MKLIGLDNLPENIKIELEENFRRELFRLARKKTLRSSKLARLLCVCMNTVLNLENGILFISPEKVRKLSEITNIPLCEIEKHVIELKTRNRKNKLEFRLPIKSSKELASLIGHCMGDGHLSERQFSFFNTNRELVDEVITNVQKAFSSNVIPNEFQKCGGWEIGFPTNIGRLISLVGGPMGAKVFTPFRVPGWIMDGNKEIKVWFIRALFDDEGFIKIKRNKKARNLTRLIGFHMAKNQEFLDQHKLFLGDMRNLLFDIGIKPSKIKKFGRSKNGISLGFTISNFKNLLNFFRKINFTSTEKRQKLKKCLETFKRFEVDI